MNVATCCDYSKHSASVKVQIYFIHSDYENRFFPYNILRLPATKHDKEK